MVWVWSGEGAPGHSLSLRCSPQTKEERPWHEDLQTHLNFPASSDSGASAEAVAIALQTTGGFCSAIWTTDLCKSPRQKSLWRHMTTEKE